MALLARTPAGLYCERGDFYIDPWQPVERAIITHAHGDHARRGAATYLATDASARVLRTRLGDDAQIETVPYGAPVSIHGVRVSLHPAGHILGSAQIRVEYQGEIWVVSGDYKTEPDETCAPFELVPCHTFVTESTFGLPIFRWTPERNVLDDIVGWWRENRDAGRASVLFAYALGKAQRILAGVRDAGIGAIVTHGAVERLTEDYRLSGVAMPPTTSAGDHPRTRNWEGALVIAPPSAAGSPWLRRFGAASLAFASGWMRIRGARRRRALDRGFVLSDHADWPALIATIEATGASQVLVTHGYREAVVRWLTEHGIAAAPIATPWETEDEPEETVQQASIFP
jgi:putative mRNA 3-end processing factor